MRLVVVALALAVPAAHATEVIDTFEAGTNPAQWGWTNNGGGAFIIQPDGGNPGAWLDSGVPYFSDHPNLTSIPPSGTALSDALASGTLVSARFDVEQLDTSDVTNCHPTSDTPSLFTLEFIDLHSDPGGGVIEAHTEDGPPTPGGPYAWQTVSFPIPSDATDVPSNWVLNAPPEDNYTWQDLMHNIDGIRLFVVSPDDITFDSCWHLGADNIVVAYDEAVDTIAADGFDTVPQD